MRNMIVFLIVLVLLSGCMPATNNEVSSKPNESLIYHEVMYVENLVYDCFFIYTTATGVTLDCELRP